jgi:hypothetical protein
MIFGYYSRIDKSKELVSKTIGTSRLQAAKSFAQRKQLDLKTFLKLYAVVTII